MLDPSLDYAPDLEWMLQSGQVSPELLLEALILEFYAPVYRLAYAILDDRRQAARVAGEAFSRALAELYKYRSQDGVEIWLYRIVLEACQKARGRVQAWRLLMASLPFLSRPDDFGDSVPETEAEAAIWLGVDRLEHETRQVVILFSVLGWSAERIAVLQGEPEEKVKSILEMTRQVFPDDAPLGDEDRLEVLKTSLQKRWPLPEIHQEHLDRLVGRITRRARLIGSRRQELVSVLEVAVIALVILLGVGVAWGMNRVGKAQPFSTPIRPINTVVVTRLAYQYVTATPGALETGPQATSTATRLRRNQYLVVQDGDTLASLGAREGTSPEALQQINRLPADAQLEAGQRLLRPDQWRRLLTATPAPFDPIEPAPAMGPPYLGEKVLQRLAVQGPRYNTLWFDAQVIDYGPHSYLGPPQLLHAQVWESRDQSLSLVGYPGQLPAEAVLHNQDGTFLALPYPPWFSEWMDFEQYDSLATQEMGKMSSTLFDTRELERGYTFEISGREPQAGVQALAFDVHNPAGQLTDRIWYDEQRGLILRRIQYLPGNPGEPLFDVQITQVAYDAAFPQDFFDSRLPWRGGFAQDVAGAPSGLESNRAVSFTERAPLAPQVSPPDFDPAKSRLTFQYPPSFPVNSSFADVQVFGDHFSLGSVSLGNPWTMICDRSPDGRWIAYVSQPNPSLSGNSRLQWFNLADPPGSTRSIGPYTGVTAFSFSPDSQKLAYFNRSSPNGKGALNVFDIAAAENKPLLAIGDVKSLVWKPDGTSLGMIARFDPGSYLDNVVVYDLVKGKVTYSAPVDYQSNAYQDWPMLNWEVEFPVEMGEMDDCAIPPQAK